MNNPTGTQQLIGFIIDQKLELEQYQQLLPKRIEEHFLVRAYVNDASAYEDLVKTIVDWEQGNKTSSLEALIDKNFYDVQILKEWKPPAIVRNIPSKDYARIHKETTHVAGVINREMAQLQKKFPDHFFELSFEFQRLGKRKFYKVHLKTFKDE